MNDADKTREPKAPKPATAIASHRVHPDKTAQYIAAQSAITDAARRSPGFVGTEVLRPGGRAARRVGRNIPSRIE